MQPLMVLQQFHFAPAMDGHPTCCDTFLMQMSAAEKQQAKQHAEVGCQHAACSMACGA